MPIVKDKYRGTPIYHMVFCRLLTAARHRGHVTYQELAKLMVLPIVGSHMGREVGYILGEISEDEHVAGRPMLSALALSKAGKAGPGFFGLARDLGALNSDHPADEQSFWEVQRDALYVTWQEPLKGSSK